jgi:hypothetical protein
MLDKIFVKDGYYNPFWFLMHVRAVRDRPPGMTQDKQLT